MDQSVSGIHLVILRYSPVASRAACSDCLTSLSWRDDVAKASRPRSSSAIRNRRRSFSRRSAVLASPVALIGEGAPSHCPPALSGIGLISSSIRSLPLPYVSSVAGGRRRSHAVPASTLALNLSVQVLLSIPEFVETGPGTRFQA